MAGRGVERGVLDQVLEALRAGESRALVVSGEPGVGKTALLEYIIEQAPDCRVVRTAGVQSEAELAFAGLHQLLVPLLERVEHLPIPQRDALRTAFGLGSGPAPDRFQVGLAVLSLLSDVAEDRPLICLLDDEQWLDRASAQVLTFVARRLEKESVALLFGTRETNDDLVGLPELVVPIYLRAVKPPGPSKAARRGAFGARVGSRQWFRGPPASLRVTSRRLETSS